MYSIALIFVFSLTAIAALPTLKSQTKIIGGNVAVIGQYPSTVALLYTADGSNYRQSCVGTIITSKAIVTAGHCLQGDTVARWRARVGSSWSNNGGSVYSLTSMLIHPSFNVRTMDSDIAIIRTIVPLVYSNVVKPSSIAGVNYNLTDNQVVWAVGFGSSAIWSINQGACASRYGVLGSNITSNMLCSGLPNSTNDAQCVGDSGGPLFHNGILVGVYSWGFSCANSQYPGISTRVSRFTTWIQKNV